MRVIIILLCAFALDLLLGDPEALSRLHPVVWMGRGIVFLESRLRAVFPEGKDGERKAGRVMACILPVSVLVLSGGILLLLYRICPPAGFLLEVIWGWQALAVKNLRDEAMRVYEALTQGTLDAARGAIARIVGRDTGNLSREGVTKAAVETVAENFSDGVTAPLLYMAIGGAPLALCYKAVNTMDSMVGYKNERYIHFGRAAARLDDAANYLPSRIAACLMIAAAGMTGLDAGNAYRIWKRDRRKHASPNSAQCEAAAAGALGIQLGGPADYFGVRHEKPYIGEAKRAAEAEDIQKVCRMEMAGSILGAVVFVLVRYLIIQVVL
ncbi:MAG: adenosylcobinamide-phosphate synthase CbiB [Eubacterium sp.]|nr:adenosylcobinamide-phosphate synthase CbiB [Eubacterium sp.]